MKKVLIVFQIFAYLNCYFGCTTSRSFVVSGSELPESLDHGNKYPIQIITLDSTHYAFEKHTYRFKNDTLIAKGGIKIPLQDIATAYYLVKEIDVAPTLLLIILGGVIVAGIIAFATWDPSWGEGKTW